jgi:hypothetical protein
LVQIFPFPDRLAEVVYILQLGTVRYLPASLYCYYC